jgi:hypothetical protein
VNADYTPNPTNGSYRFYPNRLGSSQFNFSVIYNYPSSWDRRRIPMADPTILRIGSRYYVTGTTDAANNNTNFAIYWSDNLVDWFPHMVAFNTWCLPPGVPGPCAMFHDQILRGPFTQVYGPSYVYINGQRAEQLWAPQLYMDPADPNTVHLSFCGVLGDFIPSTCGGPPNMLPGRSIYVASISKSAFLAGGLSNFFATNPAEPLAYFYKVNNGGGAELRDGGQAQGVNIPVTFDRTRWNACPPPCGWIYKSGPQTYGYQCRGNNTMLGIDPFVYFDPLQSNKRWMMYTWLDDSAWQDWNGNHVAAHPMIANRQMDAFGAPIPLAYKLHSMWWPGHDRGCVTSPCAAENWVWPNAQPPDCWIPNGTSGASGGRMGGCGGRFGVAEGPAAFARNGRSYIMYSRNGWDSPAYGMFYRHAAANIGAMGIAHWGDYLTAEQPLVMSIEREKPDGIGFGHGEVFIGPTRSGQPSKYYLIFHAKEAKVGGVFPSGYSGRTVYFKELTFNTDGSIVPLSNDGSSGNADTEGFLIPDWSAGWASSAPGGGTPGAVRAPSPPTEQATQP